MRLKALQVEGFRNLASVELDLGGPATLFYGENAQGKTNLLEAICVLGTTRSFRERSPWALVMEGRDQGVVEGAVARAGTDHQLRVEIGREGRRATRDGRKEPLDHYLSRLPVVVLSAEDRALVKGTQRVRRDFLDGAAVLERPAYLAEWSAFQRTLEQRNRVLREYQRHRQKELDAWTSAFLEAATKVQQTRADVAEKAKRQLETGRGEGDEPLTLVYRPSGDGDLAAALAAARGQEIARGCSVAGPQRDTLEILLAGKPLEIYGSAGQVRSAVWRLKLARVAMLTQATGEPPVFLLDDVEGELDAQRVRRMMELTRGRAQLFMTATRPLGPEWGDHTAYRVTGGAVAA